MAQSQSTSTLPLAIAGTLAVHLLIAVLVDVATVVGREEKKKDAPKLSLVDIKTVPVREPEPPPEPEPAPVEPPPEIAEPVTRPIQTPRAARTNRPAPSDTPPTPTVTPPADTPPAGGSPVVSLPGIAPAARGVAAASGQPTRGRLGRGGSGGGSGSGTGPGDGPGTAAPVVTTSVASIKTPAEAKEGFDYFDARKSYPAEARRLGIEGKLRVRLVVDASGKVTQARLLGSLGHGLDELALARARAIQFVPARDTDDKPVASVVIWTFTFTLPSDT